MLISTHALPGYVPSFSFTLYFFYFLPSNISVSRPLPKAEIDVDELIPSVNTTEHNLVARGATKLRCYDSRTEKWAADGLTPIREVGKNYDLKEKNIYDVAGKFCYEYNGYKFTRSGDIGKKYWFRNVFKTFPIPFVPVKVGVVNTHNRSGKLNAKFCADMMVKVISGCTARGRPSRLDYFRGGEIQDLSGWTYAVLCEERYCWV